ncbi:DUF4352 domain-containing protein [Actinophytocola sp.]|uniref:DUF4352 domain-containing protein n=1 Tax=Actinophytocola sp. TaxID=1872138 RepID=UPI002D7F5912|nr:DUF4352 domain-containing protein [Actinophytocola sp.]HET9139507.1 DUF4352 domain-containing protein [Actinophytocola sp.]
MGRSGLRWLPLLALLSTVACTSTVAGTATPGKIVGVQQRLAGEELEVTVSEFLDPAPVSDARSIRPEDGERLVAARFKITNRGDRDRLIGPIGRVEFVGSDGKTYDNALTHTTAGVEFDQLHLSPGLTVVGYVTAELPERVTVDTVQFKADFGDEGPRLRWKVVRTLTEPPPAPAPRPDSRAGAHRLGEQVTLAEERKRTGERISVAATKVIDPAPETSRVRPGPFMRLVGVEFTARNVGDVPYDDNENGTDLRLFVVFNAADEAIRAHIYGVAPGGMPLAPGEDATWSVLFEVPSSFEVDRIAFTPLFGSTTTTLWAT